MNEEQIIQWIHLHLPSPRQRDLVELLGGSSAAGELLREVGEALVEQRARNMQLLEEWFWKAWPGLSSFTRREQAILRYYFPLRRLIITDAQRSHCLTTIFGLPCRLQAVKPVFQSDQYAYLREGDYYEVMEEPLIDPDKKQYSIEIGPVDASKLPDWMPGGKHRIFLENGLLPLLLPTDYRVSIDILSDSSAAHDFIENAPVYWDQNFQPL